MIRTLLLTAMLAYCYMPAQSQLLTGRWEGTYRTGTAIDVPIRIEFKLNADSTYSVFTYSEIRTAAGPKAKTIAEADYELAGNDSIYIIEKKALFTDGMEVVCFQQFNLKFIMKKNIMILEGDWEALGPNCVGDGVIRVTKSRSKKKTESK